MSEHEWAHLRDYLSSAQGEIRYVIAPFIQSSTLAFVLAGSRAKTIVVTNWAADAIASGATDIDSFLVCQRIGATLRLHPRLHMKVYSWDLEDAIIGSANVTDRGLGLATTSNEEYLSTPLKIPWDRRLQLRRVLHESTVVDSRMYRAARGWKSRLPGRSTVPILTLPLSDATYSVASLPMSETPARVITALREGERANLSAYEMNCALHDIGLYGLRLEEDAQLATLRERFFSHPFIVRIADMMQPCVHFGEMKAWVQSNCTDEPVPSRRDLTGNVQVLFRWFVELAPSQFSVSIPGRYSQRICKK